MNLLTNPFVLAITAFLTGLASLFGGFLNALFGAL